MLLAGVAGGGVAGGGVAGDGVAGHGTVGDAHHTHACLILSSYVTPGRSTASLENVKDHFQSRCHVQFSRVYCRCQDGTPCTDKACPDGKTSMCHFPTHHLAIDFLAILDMNECSCDYDHAGNPCVCNNGQRDTPRNPGFTGDGKLCNTLEPCMFHKIGAAVTADQIQHYQPSFSMLHR